MFVLHKDVLERMKKVVRLHTVGGSESAAAADNLATFQNGATISWICRCGSVAGAFSQTLVEGRVRRVESAAAADNPSADNLGTFVI